MAPKQHTLDHLQGKREEELELALAYLESAHERQASQRGFLRAVFEHIPWSALVVDRESRVQLFNRQFRETFGTPDSEAVDAGLSVGQALCCLTARHGSGECGTMEPCVTCQIHVSRVDAIHGTTTRRKMCTFDFAGAEHRRCMSLLVTAAPFDFRGRRHAMVMLEDTTERDAVRSSMRAKTSFAGIVGTHPRMLAMFATIRQVADVDVPVLVLGERGTGKGLVARAIHMEGSRSAANFVPVACDALPDTLLESELFGYARGSSTGAVRDRKGRLELAAGGTIFLDEIGDMSPSVQVTLLRVLQEGTFERLGGEKTISFDARVICATSRSLELLVEAGGFLADLYYRLWVVPITVPPLRDRIEDLPLLAEHILEGESITSGRSKATLLPEVADALTTYHWPGNVRELKNALQYALVTSKGGDIGLEHLPPGLRNAVALGH